MASTNENIIYLSESRKVAMGDAWYSLATASHFWMYWRFKTLEHILQSCVSNDLERTIDIGSGNLVFAREIVEHLGLAVDCCELNESIADELPAESDLRVLVYDITERHPSVTEHYDAAFLFDVIEHIEDDTAFLEAAAAHLKPGGCVIVNVPACESFFSAYDRAAGHLRRYDKASLESVFRAAGLEPIAVWYWGFFLLPLMLVRNFRVRFASPESVIDKGFAMPLKSVNALLRVLQRLERPLLGRLPVGTSLMAVGVRSDVGS